MRSPRRMRLDLRGFQRAKRAGLLLVSVVIVAASFTAALIEHEMHVANYYLSVSGYSIRSSSVFDRVVLGSSKPVAVMFESPTCPVCKRMYPYWAVLERESDSLPIRFLHVMFSPATQDVFMRYHVTDTPTFIVFVNGRPVARHVGAFGGSNITNAMLEWALFSVGAATVSEPEKLAQEGLRVFNERCSACHGEVKGLDKASLEAWLSSRSGQPDPLAEKMKEALEKNMTLRKLYGSYGELMTAVASMRKYLPDLSSYEIDRAAYFLDYVSAILEGKAAPRIVGRRALANTTTAAPARGASSPLEEAGTAGASAVSALAALAAGAVAAFSPCVLPLLATYVSVVGASGRRVSASGCVACGAASFAGVIAIGLVFALASSLASSLQSILVPVVAAAVVAAGVASLLGVPVELEGLVSTRRGGLAGFCTVYGFLAVQCNLPIVVGALLLVASSGNLASGLLVAGSFAAGISIPLAAAVYAVSRVGGGVVSRIMARYDLLSRVGGAVLLAAGVYLLLYSLQLV